MTEEQKLVVSETPSSTWHYHLRLVGDEGIHYSGWPNLKALCGAKLGWDTEIPLSYYDPERKPVTLGDGVCCRKCWQEAVIKEEMT